MRVHAVQLAYGDGETVRARTERVAGIVRAQHGADLVLLPELWPQGGFAYDRWTELAEGLDGPTVTAMRGLAGELGVMLHMGSLVERDDDGSLHNTSVLLDRDGSIAATYRKIHLFGFGEGEPTLMTAGEKVVVHEGIGLATCYDLRFPEQFRALLDAGAEVVLLPAAWPAKRVAHWRLLARARAVEDQCFVVACNTAGTHSGVTMGGMSVVVDPTGEVLAEAGPELEAVVAADLDLDALRRWRETFPVLADRRL
jgi:predicted amidohydrolase